MEPFNDIHPMFANQYLDSDKALICEVHTVAGETVSKLTGKKISTPKADAVIEGLSTDEYNNILVF